MRTIYLIISLIICFSNSSCTKKQVTENIKSNNEIIAKVDTINISYKEVDRLIRQEIFDELNKINAIRRIAVDQIIKDKVLHLESTATGLSVDQLTDSIFAEEINKKTIKQFIQTNKYENAISHFERTLETINSNSDKGREIILERFKKQVLNEYVETLKRKHKIVFFDKKPSSPLVETKDLRVYYRGNLKSKITFLQVSDIECSKCIESAPIFEKIYNKYKNEVRFGYTQFGSHQSISSLALDAAHNQNKFWELHDTILDLGHLPTKEDLFKLAKELNLDLKKFTKDFESQNTLKLLQQNFKKIENAGIYGTPTILINNKLVYDSSSILEIEKKLTNEINRFSKTNH